MPTLARDVRGLASVPRRLPCRLRGGEAEDQAASLDARRRRARWTGDSTFGGGDCSGTWAFFAPTPLESSQGQLFHFAVLQDRLGERRADLTVKGKSRFPEAREKIERERGRGRGETPTRGEAD